jgi:hypothetical protein
MRPRCSCLLLSTANVLMFSTVQTVTYCHSAAGVWEVLNTALFATLQCEVRAPGVGYRCGRRGCSRHALDRLGVVRLSCTRSRSDRGLGSGLRRRTGTSVSFPGIHRETPLLHPPPTDRRSTPSPQRSRPRSKNKGICPKPFISVLGVIGRSGFARSPHAHHERTTLKFSTDCSISFQLQCGGGEFYFQCQ